MTDTNDARLREALEYAREAMCGAANATRNQIAIHESNRQSANVWPDVLTGCVSGHGLEDAIKLIDAALAAPVAPEPAGEAGEPSAWAMEMADKLGGDFCDTPESEAYEVAARMFDRAKQQGRDEEQERIINGLYHNLSISRLIGLEALREIVAAIQAEQVKPIQAAGEGQ